ncbi:MAG: putative cyclic nucleotide-binding transcriptional regulator [Symbiobacteriaceae bacterium]|jgi:CRP/FNR family transcriptional regulator|nr:putative cyclic nucleotide-binding transcriptional regulator [Symbiobacteriaceae bacterium]
MLRTLHSAPVVTALDTLPEHVAADVMKVMHLRAFRRGSVLFDQGEEPRAIFFVETGRVKWHKVSEDGNEQILQVAEPGQAVGLVALLDRKPYIAAATALEEVTAWVLTIADFDRMVATHPVLALQVMQLLGDGVRWLLEHVHAMSHRNAHERVSSVLIRKAEAAEDGVRVIPLTHQEIAHLAGMARETVSRVLSDFQRRGAVRLTRSAVMLLDATRFYAPAERRKLG